MPCESCDAIRAKWNEQTAPACPYSLGPGCQCCQEDCPLKIWWEKHTHTVVMRLQKEWIEHIEKDHRANRSHVGNGTYNGPFAFTLTMSPKDGLSSGDMIASVKKLMSQKSCIVKKFAWNLEYGNEEAMEHPHIHGMYETESGGRIEAKHFKRVWPIWDEKTKAGAGFRGGYHRPVKAEEKYEDYIKKQGRIGESSDNF